MVSQLPKFECIQRFFYFNYDEGKVNTNFVLILVCACCRCAGQFYSGSFPI